MELRKHEYYEHQIWPEWIDKIKRSPDRIIFLHGIMGSELYDKVNERTLWLDWGVWHEVENLGVETLTPEGLIDSRDQEIYARSTVHSPIGSDPYAEFFRESQAGLFCYDWRESVPVEVKRLALFLKKVREEVQEPVNFVTHSMGGCVLLYFLGKYREFDDYIDRVIFCAPPFHGAVKPIRILEDGDGAPVDPLVKNRILRDSAATMPGLFQLTVAPPEYWVHQVPEGPELQYPIRSGESLYRLPFWTMAKKASRRLNILAFAERYHKERWNAIAHVIERLGEKIFVIVGLNGKTASSVTREKGWSVIHKAPGPGKEAVSNGDGTVLFQSSYLPGLPTEHYWALAPDTQQNTHGEIMDDPATIHDIRKILKGQAPSKLTPYSEFIKKLDWSGDLPQTRSLEKADDLNYLERARLRRLTPKKRWGKRLNPGGDDALNYFLAEEAALEVLNGQNTLENAARRIGRNPKFLEEYIKSRLMPALF